jgi:hypothetical protein
MESESGTTLRQKSHATKEPRVEATYGPMSKIPLDEGIEAKRFFYGSKSHRQWRKAKERTTAQSPSPSEKNTARGGALAGENGSCEP